MFKFLSRFFILFSVLCIFAYAIGCGSSTSSTDGSGSGSGGGDVEEVIEAEGTDEGDEFIEIGVAPTVTKLVDSNAEELSDNPDDNTTRLSAKTTNKYTVTFSETMNPDSLTSENFYLFCNGTEQPMDSIEAAENGEDDIENNEWVITMSSQLPQYAECTLTFGEEITDMDDFNLEEVTYVWGTKCASSSDFGNQETFEACWLTKNIPSGATLSYGSLIMNFTSVNSSTDANM
ncbi:Ig-like domain-containing protein, partial [bacterium]|nr:Ig-like domain-containing protein [bacterium]